MVEETNQYLVEDGRRRAAEINDIAKSFLDETALHADIYEIRAYLQNRDLGMSMKYGLGASLFAIEQRFKEHRIRTTDSNRGGRIVYLAEDGSTLVDTATGDPLPVLLSPTEDNEQGGVWIDTDLGMIVATQPVRYKGGTAGRVMGIHSTYLLQRHLLDSSSQPIREILITEDGQWLPDGNSRPLPKGLTTKLAKLPTTQVALLEVPLSADGEREEILALSTSLPTLGLRLVKLIPPELAYGHILPFQVLAATAIVPLLMFWGAIRLDHARNTADKLKQDIALADQQRRFAEQKNLELSEEIHNRELVEQALTVSEERWALAANGANDGIWDWNPVTGAVFYSSRWKSLLGYDENEITSDISEKEYRIHPEDWATVNKEISRHLHGDTEHYQCEYRMLGKDGDYIWVLDRASALFDAGGRAIRVTGSMSDISERRAAGLLLEERNIQLNAIFETSPDGMVSFDAEYRVIFVNPAFLRLTHLEATALIGLGETEFSRLLNESCSAHAPFRGTAALRINPPAQDRRELIELVVPGKPTLDIEMIEARSTTVSQILFCRDVTSEREVEQMKSEFLSTAAHELRTPMASVYGYAELLMQPGLDAATQKEFAATIFQQSELVASIVNELLDLSRIESRRGKDFVIERFKLEDFVRDAITGCKPPDERKPPTIKRSAADLWVRADRKKMQQSLNNILSNAYKYSPAGGPVEIEFISDNERSGILVRDHGIGMTQEQLERVFERFYRADTSGRIPGTGLGMSIVKEIVELHGGKVEIHGRKDAGCEVTLWLPNAGDSA